MSHCCVTHRLAPRSQPVVIRRFIEKNKQKKEHLNCNVETNQAEPSRAVRASLGSAHRTFAKHVFRGHSCQVLQAFAKFGLPVKTGRKLT